MRVDGVREDGAILIVTAAARPVVVRVGGAPLRALEKLSSSDLTRLEPGDDAYAATLARLFPDLATPRKIVGFSSPCAEGHTEASLAALSRARGYDAWRPRTTAGDAAFWARRSGLPTLPPPPTDHPTHVLLAGEELPVPRALVVGGAAEVPGAARQRGRAILARLALKLRAVASLR